MARDKTARPRLTLLSGGRSDKPTWTDAEVLRVVLAAYRAGTSLAERFEDTALAERWDRLSDDLLDLLDTYQLVAATAGASGEHDPCRLFRINLRTLGEQMLSKENEW